MKGINSFDENGYWSCYSNDNWSVCKIYDDVLGYEYTLSGERFDALEVVDKLASLEAQLSEAKARLAGYEVGYDPKVRLPKHDQWILVKHMNDDLDDAPRQVMYDSGDDGEDGVKYYPFSEDGWVCWTDITRWFPLPGSKEEK